MIRYPIIVFAFALFGGCAAPYIRPPDDRAATLQFPESLALVYYYDNGNDCSDLKYLDRDNSPLARQDRTIIVRSDKRIAFLISGLAPGKLASSCPIMMSFELQPKGRYRITYTFSADSEKCYTGLVRVVDGREIPAPEVNLKQMAQRPGALAPSCASKE